MALFVLAAIFLAIFIVESIYYRHHAMENLDLKVDFSKDVANCGENVELIEIAENKKRLPLPFLILKMEVPREIMFLDMTNTSASDYLYREDMLTVKPYSKHTRRIKAQCTKRGYYSLQRIGITTSDMLLTERLTKDFPTVSYLTVLPEIITTNDIKTLTSVTLSEIQCRRTLFTDPFSHAGIREYTTGDPMKSINWKASARSGELMVNQNASTCFQKVHIFLNLDYYNPKRSTSLLEKSISLTYTYLIELAEQGIPAAVYSNGVDVVSGKPVISAADLGSGTLGECAVKLARIDLKKPVVPFSEVLEKNIHSIDREDYILVISPSYSEPFRKQLEKVIPAKPSLRWLMPCYKTTAEIDTGAILTPSYTRWEVLGHD